MQAYNSPVVALVGTYPIRVAPDQKAGELSMTFLQLDDLFMARLPFGEFKRLALVAHQHVNNELVEADLQPDCNIRIAQANDRVDGLLNCELDPVDHVT